jgi:hypothetical protein
MQRLLLGICAALVLAAPALAFEPEPGNRAYPIVGHDIVSGRTLDLEDYRGQWVLLVFWTSW